MTTTAAIFFVRGFINRQRLTTRGLEDMTFFVFPMNVEASGPYVFHLYPDLKLPGPMNAVYRATRALNEGVASFFFISTHSGELVKHPPPPGSEGVMAFGPAEDSPYQNLAPAVMDWIREGIQTGVTACYYSHGWMIIESLYLKSDNFQGWHRVIDPFTQFDYVKRFPG